MISNVFLKDNFIRLISLSWSLRPTKRSYEKSQGTIDIHRFRIFPESGRYSAIFKQWIQRSQKAHSSMERWSYLHFRAGLLWLALGENPLINSSGKPCDNVHAQSRIQEICTEITFDPSCTFRHSSSLLFHARILPNRSIPSTRLLITTRPLKNSSLPLQLLLLWFTLHHNNKLFMLCS